MVLENAYPQLLHIQRFCKYKYLHVKMASLAILKSCMSVGHFFGGKYLTSCTLHVLVISLVFEL